MRFLAEETGPTNDRTSEPAILNDVLWPGALGVTFYLAAKAMINSDNTPGAKLAFTAAVYAIPYSAMMLGYLLGGITGNGWHTKEAKEMLRRMFTDAKDLPEATLGDYIGEHRATKVQSYNTAIGISLLANFAHHLYQSELANG